MLPVYPLTLKAKTGSPKHLTVSFQLLVLTCGEPLRVRPVTLLFHEIIPRASNCFSISSTLPARALSNTRLATQSPGTTGLNGNLSQNTLPVDCGD